MRRAVNPIMKHRRLISAPGGWTIRRICALLLLALPSFTSLAADALPRAEWGAPVVTVSQSGATWTLAGTRNSAMLDAQTLGLTVQAGNVTWAMVGSGAHDLEIKDGTTGEKFFVRLADAAKITAAPYDSGASTGVKLTLSGWKKPNAAAVDLTLHLTLAFEGPNEELAFTVAADEAHGWSVHELNWPTAMDAREVDDTVLNHYRGILLPRSWPEAYNPIRGDRNYPNDPSTIQSDIVECWSQAWWGFERGPAAMMFIIETPDDAAYQWSHPAGGPTVIGPRWREQLGKLGYARRGRMVFFEKGNYVDLAKRYRAHAIETGLWVPLREKIARSPKVASLIGGVETRIRALRNIVPESRLYKKDHPEENHTLVPFAESARQLREFKSRGVDRLNVVLTGWPRLGYDRQHPDVLPPAPEAGGYEGMKVLADTCRELGYNFWLHDQYRDYYVDAPSFRPEFAVHEEDAGGPPTIFPGTRFGSFKEGSLSFLTAWDGGKQTQLNATFMLPHVKKNYAGLFAHGIHPDGSYQDVFGYVPPDEDFNPEHPTTRTEAKRAMADVLRWSRENLGLVGTEAGCDWTAPFVDVASPLGPGKAGIPVPLFSLVYHDAVMVQYSPTEGGGEARMNRPDRPNWLFGMLNGAPTRADLRSDRTREIVAQLSALHRRVALLELTSHEFLAADHLRERSTFADGTTVTVDWTKKTVQVSPELK